jgi:hypothetical protein
MESAGISKSTSKIYSPIGRSLSCNRLPHHSHHLLYRWKQQKTLPNQLLPIHQHIELPALANHSFGVYAQLLFNRSRRPGGQITKSPSPGTITDHDFIHAPNLLQITSGGNTLPLNSSALK